MLVLRGSKFLAIRPKVVASPRSYKLPDTVRAWVFSWYTMNYLIQFAVMGTIAYFYGVVPILYLAVSVLFGGSLHPMAGHFIAEHYVTTMGQETYSYYGSLNLLAFNVGYHNEHHDFPNIPWTLLPELRKIAPEYYDELPTVKSWTWTIIDFILKPGLGPYSRIKRKEIPPAKVTKDAMTAANTCEKEPEKEHSD
ncbi:Sphingolipid delta(4)-desaturase DES1 [Phlyctochytrium bullatum]|nr:Sphingolipid delta(4)-desaturase DES1 [Phlyctochytrium bullatum]